MEWLVNANSEQQSWILSETVARAGNQRGEKPGADSGAAAALRLEDACGRSTEDPFSFQNWGFCHHAHAGSCKIAFDHS